MRDEQASFTAAWVAMCRSLGSALPADARLCADPLGAKFGGPILGRLAAAVARAPDAMASRAIVRAPYLSHFVAYMQVRTRALDDALTAFARAGGTQIVILGAGFDCRAVRLRESMQHARVFEVDHPATQEKKRRIIAGANAESAPVSYVAWHFERDPMEGLPAALTAVGHDASKPTLTIWEGVTMYLEESDIEKSVAAVRAFSANGSVLAFTYFDRERLDHPRPSTRIVRRLVASRGEPFRFGWRPAELPAWLRARGFVLETDRDALALAEELLPPAWARKVVGAVAHVAIARVAE